MAVDGSHDFDFYVGRWRIVNRRLLQRLQGCTEWETFEALSESIAVLDGFGNFDQFLPENWRPGFAGCTLRIYNPTTQQWGLYWADNISGKVWPPVLGSFRNGVGVFEGDDFEGDIPVRVRFIWSDITPTTVRWEQAFSTDGGVTWEVNWIMESTRV